MQSTVKTFLLVLLLCQTAFTQNMEPVKTEAESMSIMNMQSVDRISIIKTEESFKLITLERALYDFQESVSGIRPKNIIPQLDIISSFRSNIRFGGFWDKYTIINFTPEMFVKPADFISVYALHSTSYFVPVEGIKQNIKSMALRSAAVMAVDNSIKMFLGTSKIIGPVISFIAKNFLIYTINELEKKNDAENNLLNYDYHYYSVSIRF